MGAGLGDADARRARLIKALQAQPDAAACDVCLSALDGYVAAQLAGQDYAAQFPDVALHLDACLDCAGAYARLYEVERAAAAGRLPVPDQAPAPDLSFLPARAAGPLPSPTAALVEQVRQALRRTGNRLTLQLSAALLPLLRPPPATAPVRGPADVARYGDMVLLLEPDEALRSELPVRLSAYRDAHHPELCLVEIVVEPPGRHWPDLENIPVVLQVAGERRQATTDAWGLVSFADVPISALAGATVEVTL